MCFQRSNYTINNSFIFFISDHTNNISNTHISRPFIYFRLFCNVTAACQIKIINNFSPKTVRFLISIWAWHKEYTWTANRWSLRWDDSNSKLLLNILPGNMKRVSIFFSNGLSYLSKCPYKIEFHCDQYHSYNEKSEICKYLMCDKQYYNLVAF